MSFLSCWKRGGRGESPRPLSACELPPLPETGTFRSREEVEQWAAEALTRLGLEGWAFRWDRAIRRMGCCRPARRQISLSRYFAELYLQENPAEVRRTLLHELAHALVWEWHRVGGHGPLWQHCCALLGIPGERATKRVKDFAPSRPPRPVRYVLCHEETGEVYRTYTARPRRTQAQLRRCYIPGRRQETLGRLCIRPATDAEARKEEGGVSG